MHNSSDYSLYSSHFQAYVAWVDHNGSVNDEQKEGSIEYMSPHTGRNFHLGVIKLGGASGGGVLLNVMVPQDVMGSFKLPQVGDIVWIEESRRDPGRAPVYLYSTYNSTPDPTNIMAQAPVPQWGSFPGDYGHLRTHRDHSRQFSATVNSNFVKKYVTHITGYRFRSFYRGNLVEGRYAVRGDAVFDIDGNINAPYLVEEGAYIGYGGDLEDDQGEYPNPLNVPVEREDNPDYTYVSLLNEPVPVRVSGSQDAFDSKISKRKFRKEKHVLKTKNYHSYQPIVDKTYLDKTEFEREIPAAEEYQVSLRGNNKLLIQDQYGDGEHLLITFKNQYDAGFSVLHNADKGQVRLRDHLGQGVLLEANAEAPRVISWTANRQVIEQGAIADVGEFTYIRNGSVFGDSKTSFGKKTGLEKSDVSNQEFLMVSTSDIIGELASRLSPGMLSVASAAGSPGIYFRNNVDPDETQQTFSMYKLDTDLVLSLAQENIGLDGLVQNSSITQSMDGTSVTQTTTVEHVAPGTGHLYTETTIVSDSQAVKASLMERDGSDTIATLDTITADDTAFASKTITTKSDNIITYTSDGSTPSVNINVKEAGNTVADYMMQSADITITKYDADAPVSKIEQLAGGTINVTRIDAGLSSPINVGVDGGDGIITIGNAAAPVNIDGLSVTITAPDVDINPS